MGNRVEILLAGSGGQGLILAGLILAEAAVIHDHKNACQTQSYGPEARGGASKSEVVIDTGEIDYPKVISADVLMALTQEACDKYSGELKRDGLLIVDAMYVDHVPNPRAYKLPITKVAEQTTGRAITANMVGLGVLAGLTGVVSRQALEAAVAARAPKGTAEINLKALEAGYRLVAEYRRGGK
ncbi:MAG: 2-oxoacid:acceptor oxidoreductase family protein [Chloroflexota bacterium]